jgi:hypothetical protein
MEQFDVGAPQYFSSQCFQLLQNYQDSNEMVILFQFQPRKIIPSYYISPKAADLLMPLIQKYQGTPCDKPPKNPKPNDPQKRIGFVAGDQQYFFELYGTEE